MRENGLALIVELAGELNGAALSQINQEIITAHRPGLSILLHMTAVTHLSSAGLRALLMLERHLASEGSHLILVGLAEELLDTMSITGFLNFFTTFDDLDSGLDALKQGYSV